MNESSPDNVSYVGQSAYDVADLLKQYFRDLPEPIFTSKLTDTFLQIYQCKCPYKGAVFSPVQGIVLKNYSNERGGPGQSGWRAKGCIIMVVLPPQNKVGFTGLSAASKTRCRNPGDTLFIK